MSFIDQFVNWANNELLQNEEAKDYLYGRGVIELQINRHRLGFISSDYHVDSKLDKNHDEEICGNTELVHRWCDSCRFTRWSSEYKRVGGEKILSVGTRIIGNIVLPMTSYSGNIVGFQVRSIIGKNFDSFTILKRSECHFFGTAANIDSIWKNKEVFVVEGPFDCLTFERLVVPNVVALMTSAPGTGQVKFFRRFVDTINLCLDNDKAGRDGVKSFFGKFGGTHNINDIRFGNIKKLDGKICKDVNEVWSFLGDEKTKRLFKTLVEKGKLK